MCTVTVFRNAGSVVLTMNRDEQRERHEGGLYNDANVVFPVDQQSGGTWCGVSSQGLALALLNRYQDDAGLGTVSRGQIIPAALQQTSLDAAAGWVVRQDLSVYNPFTLLLVSRQAMLQFTWNGEQLAGSHVEARPWFMWSSSSWQTGRVLAVRQQRFDRWSNAAQASAGRIPELHVDQRDWSKQDSILMERPATHTKSICQMVLSESETRLSYYNESSLAQLQFDPATSPTSSCSLPFFQQ